MTTVDHEWMVARRGGPESRTTITDVALAAGVNKGTVSRALRGSYGVAPLTRKRILEVAEQMHFSASPLASALASGQPRKTVGIVIPTIDSWYYISVASGAKEVLTTAGFRVDLIALAVDPGYDNLGSADFYELRNELYAGRDALLLADTISINLRPSGSDKAWPPTAPGISLSTVPGSFVDDYAGGQLAAEHLLGLGHRRMAMVDGRKPHSPHPGVWEDRANGFRDAVRASGFEIDDEFVVSPGDAQAADGERALRSLLQAGGTPPTAIFCQTDELAFGVLSEMRQHGLRCPDDVSVIGFDGHPLSRFWGLTTVNQHADLQGMRSARALISALGEANPPVIDGARATQILLSLDVRDTTSRPRRRAGEPPDDPNRAD
jgi:DNA-binding LacI/PurR family transcriptional regulator